MPRTETTDSKRSSSARIPRNIRKTNKRSRQKLDSQKRKGTAKAQKTHAKIENETSQDYRSPMTFTSTIPRPRFRTHIRLHRRLGSGGYTA